MWSQKKNVACVPVRFFSWHSIPLIFIFHVFFIFIFSFFPAHFHFLTAAIKFSCFSFNEIRPPLFISLSLLLFHDLLSTSVKTKI